MNESDALLPGSLAYYADEARGCTAEAVPTGDDDDAKIPGPSETGGRRAIVPPPRFSRLFNPSQSRGQIMPANYCLHHRIFRPSYGPEEQIDNDQDVGLVAK